MVFVGVGDATGEEEICLLMRCRWRWFVITAEEKIGFYRWFLARGCEKKTALRKENNFTTMIDKEVIFLRGCNLFSVRNYFSKLIDSQTTENVKNVF